MRLFCAFEAYKPFDFASSTTAVLKMLSQHELFQRNATSILQVTSRYEQRSVLYVVHVLRPAHVVMFAVFASMIHIMHHIHVCLKNVGVHYMTCQGKIVETCREEEHEHCVFIVEGKVKTKILFLVVLVEAYHLAEEHMILEGGHVEVVDLQASGNQVIGFKIIGKLRVDNFCVSDKCKVEHTGGGVGTDDVIEEVEVEVLVHGKRGD